MLRLCGTLGMTLPYSLIWWGRMVRLNVTQLVTAEQGPLWIPDLRPSTGDLAQSPGWVFTIWLVEEHPFSLHCGAYLVLVGEKEVSFDKGIVRLSPPMTLQVDSQGSPLELLVWCSCFCPLSHMEVFCLDRWDCLLPCSRSEGTSEGKRVRQEVLAGERC